RSPEPVAGSFQGAILRGSSDSPGRFAFFRSLHIMYGNCCCTASAVVYYLGKSSGCSVNGDWFAERLQELRKAAGMTQDQLAKKAWLSMGGIRDLEQKRRKPAWETVLKLAAALDVDCRAFAEEPASPAKAPQMGRPMKSTEQPPEAKKGSRRKK